MLVRLPNITNIHGFGAGRGREWRRSFGERWKTREEWRGDGRSLQLVLEIDGATGGAFSGPGFLFLFSPLIGAAGRNAGW